MDKILLCASIKNKPSDEANNILDKKCYKVLQVFMLGSLVNNLQKNYLFLKQFYSSLPTHV